MCSLFELQLRPEIAESGQITPSFPVQPSAVALLWLPATINQAHVFPRPVATVNNAETRDLGLMTREGCGMPANSRPWTDDTRRDPPERIHAVARLSVPLAARDQGTKCALLMVADRERARPRKSVTGRMAKFDRFPLFSASLERQLNTVFRPWPKTAEIDQVLVGHSLCAHPATTVGLCRRRLKAG